MQDDARRDFSDFRARGIFRACGEKHAVRDAVVFRHQLREGADLRQRLLRGGKVRGGGKALADDAEVYVDDLGERARVAFGNDVKAIAEGDIALVGRLYVPDLGFARSPGIRIEDRAFGRVLPGGILPVPAFRIEQAGIEAARGDDVARARHRVGKPGERGAGEHPDA